MSKRKIRPKRGDLTPPGASQRDIAAATGLSTRQQWQARLIASIPEEEFERLIESDDVPTITELVNVARRRDGLAKRVRKCPHCGGAL